jgi:hypothetical protein
MKTLAIAIVASVILSVGISYVAIQGKVGPQGPKGDTGSASQFFGNRNVLLTYDLSNNAVSDEVRTYTSTTGTTLLFWIADTSGSINEHMTIQVYMGSGTLEQIKANNALPHYQWVVEGGSAGCDYILGWPAGIYTIRISKTAGISRAYLAVVDLS